MVDNRVNEVTMTKIGIFKSVRTTFKVVGLVGLLCIIVLQCYSGLEALAELLE